MDIRSRAAQLCLAGTEAEFERRLDDARASFREAWEAAIDDYDASIAAHYIAHLELDPHEALRWHLTAIEAAQRTERAIEFMGSLHVSLGGAYEKVGLNVEAQRHYELAAKFGVVHIAD